MARVRLLLHCGFSFLLASLSLAQSPPPPPASPSPSVLSAPAPTVASDVQLWTLPDRKCQAACTAVSAVTLNWCSATVTYASFCDYSGSGDLVTLEQTAINAFIAMEQSLTTLPSDLCKVKMRQWMCWQLFPQCAGSTTRLLPVCRINCESIAVECAIGWLDCAAEVEEVRGTAPPWWFTASGAYIRGIKPASAEAAANVSNAPLVVGVNAVTGQGNVYGERPTCTGAAIVGATPHTASMLLLAATTWALVEYASD